MMRFDYEILPGVVRAHTETTLTIRPLGENARFLPGVTYTVEVHGRETSHANYRERNFTSYSVVPSPEGTLVFSHPFGREQEYLIHIDIPAEAEYNDHPYWKIHRRPEICHIRLFVYALEEDWYGLTPYKGDFHLHSSRSDGQESIGGLLGLFRRAGYDFFALTDHALRESSVYAAERLQQMPGLMTVFPGEEFHYPTEHMHIVFCGGDASVNGIYRADPQKATAEKEAIEQSLPALPDEVDRDDYAWRIWAAQKAHEHGALALITHPYWIWCEVYFMGAALTETLIRSRQYDALEVLNTGCGPLTNNIQVNLWNEMRANGASIPIVGNSDGHFPDRLHPDTPLSCYSIVLAKELTFESVAEAVKDGRCAAVEQELPQSTPMVTAELRMMKYAQFLTRNFYPAYAEKCGEQGRQLKIWFETESPRAAQLLALLKEETDAYRLAYFGH